MHPLLNIGTSRCVTWIFLLWPNLIYKIRQDSYTASISSAICGLCIPIKDRSILNKVVVVVVTTCTDNVPKPADNQQGINIATKTIFQSHSLLHISPLDLFGFVRNV